VAPSVENQGALAAAAVLLLISFGAKAAVFPLFNWLPASYHTLPCRWRRSSPRC
jgi:multicomponent Na+:H+ antiporter subunit D